MKNVGFLGVSPGCRMQVPKVDQFAIQLQVGARSVGYTILQLSVK